MFHKQNIPSAPPKETAQNNTNDTTITKEEQAMPDASDNNVQQNVQSSPFQRPNAMTGQAYGTAQTKTVSDGRKLIIGEGITMSGEIENCDMLIVEGTVEATLNGAKLLDIAESGIFFGSVDIEEADIAGRFDGDLTVDGRLTIRSSGSIKGSIVYRELIVEAGANIEGKISSLASGNAKGDAAAADFSKLKAASKKSSDADDKKKANAA